MCLLVSVDVSLSFLPDGLLSSARFVEAFFFDFPIVLRRVWYGFYVDDF